VRLVPRRAARRAEPAEPPDEPETKLVERRAMERARGEGARRAGAAAPSVPPVDLDRLTDQVVRALDRRLVAQRERQGRR
jgi:hypothetical protein